MDKPIEWLGKVAERHKEWIAIVKSFGEYDYCEDIVQEGYLTIYKYANEDKVIDDEEFTIQIPNDTQMDEQVAFHKICTMIDDHIDGWRWYENRLFKLYRDSDLSIRGIAAETNISWVSIFNSLKNAKQEIKDKFQEDWEDYKNKDYDRI